MSAELPFAIVGIGCKLPGGSDTKDLYYEFLRNKGDGMTKPPSDRWDYDHWGGYPGEPGKYSSAMGGFINGIDQFDPLEFGMSMKEAQHLDPSSRLILEVAHQALVDSGVDYRGSHTGVYVAQLLLSASEMGDTDRYENNSYSSLGKCIALRANRVSFIFDLRGPSLTLDTACSSSATAMHLAMSAIKLGEIDQALVIGGSIVAHPMQNVMMSDLGVLSPTGSSKSFDSEADGYARAEGFAATFIKRLDKAIADNDHVYSIITGSSINSNGRGISLTTPEGDMQEEVIRHAYSLAKRQPSDSFFVELHVTGTPTGDPIEVNTAGKIFSVGRDSNNFLRVGSVKANIGHTEGCSFLASLIKVSLMLEHKEIIPNIRYKKPNPKINFSNWFMKVQTQLEPITPMLAASDGKWVASISSYGIGGSNSHVVLESFESAPFAMTPTRELTASSASPPLYLFVIAAHTESAILRWRASLAKLFQGIAEDGILRSLSYNLARQSRPCAVRSFAVAPTISSDINFSETVLTNPKVNPKLCLVFSGQGPQHIAMGRELCASYPVFLATIEQSDETLIRNYGRESFLERTRLFMPNEQAKLPENIAWPVEDVVYSIVFMQLALVDLIKSLGIEYGYVVGHSIGEIAMGYASGHYDKVTAIGIAVARAAAMKKAEGNGSMVALGICFQRARYMIKQVLEGAGAADGLWIAAINSPDAVTVAGREELIDILAGIAKGRGFFSAKLNVTCAFHTPLMEPQEEVFKTLMKAVSGNLGMKPPVVRTMSTVDGEWLERDLDVDYCWDNIRRPVLFGSAIDKIVKENGSGNVLFLEIAPHPVLRSYILQCKGQPISLIRRPNPKVPAQNTGEHYQFLEGIGTLLASGFKAVDLARLCATPDGRQDFFRCKMPDYPYNKTTCSSESALNRSIRLSQKPRPLSSSLFRMSLGTHPDLAGHLIFEVPLFPLSGYLDSVLENGARVINDTVILRPLVLNVLGTNPAHVGCVINGNQWEFRTAATNTFDNGNIQLDAVHARGSFLRHNPRLNSSTPRFLDLKSKLALARGHITGEEFYKSIPSAYGYREYFSTCIKQVHEVSDENSWGGSGYLVELEIPTDTSDGRDQGYVIHPSILDSVMHSVLAMFIDMRSKSFDFNGTFLPTKVGSIARWDGGDLLDLGSQLRGTFWAYLTIRTWAPEGPFKSDYVVTNSHCQVLLTIEGVEFLLAGVERASTTDNGMEECLTTVWQPKIFPLTDYNLPSALSLDRPSYLCRVFEELITKAQTAGRYIIRTLDMDTSEVFSKALDSSLVSSLRVSQQLLVEYFCIGSSANDADAKARAMRYPHARPVVLDPSNVDPGEYDIKTHSFDIVLQTIDLLDLPLDIGTFLQYLVPSGVLLLITDRKSAEEMEGESTQQLQNLSAFVKQLEAISDFKVSVANLDEGGALILIRSTTTRAETSGDHANELVVHHFTHGTEAQLVKIIHDLPENAEIWIVGDDDAIGIGALGIAACLIAESPDFVVRSLLFEDHALGTKARDDTVRSLRQNSALLEQHMKYTSNGDIFVRRLVYGTPYVKASPAPGDMIESPIGGNNISTHIQPRIGPTEVQVSVNFLSMDVTPVDNPCVAFLGTVTRSGADVKKFSAKTRVIGIANYPVTHIVTVDQSSIVPLPDNVTDRDAVALPIASLVPWLALVENSKISDSSTILLLGAGSCIGFIAVQLCQRFGAKFFCAVATPADARRLSLELHVDEQSITTSLPGDDISPAIQMWLAMNNLKGFDVVFNLQGTIMHGTEIDSMTAMGHYIHHNVTSSDRANIPLGVPITQVINISALVGRYPSRVTASLADLLAAQTSEHFKLPSHSVSFSTLSNSASLSVSKTNSLAIVPNVRSSIHITESGQLFDPRKCYLLVGGSSELGVRITVWMASHGARHFVLTSRRGPRALTKVDLQYLCYLRSSDVSVRVLPADAGKRQDMETVIVRANELAPIGGILLMTVVSRDGLFSSMDQKSFDDVYLSKVRTLNTVLSCVKPATLEFLLLFSTIGSVFGNAGQAAYCASQLYLDRMAEILPNTISISLPPITDSGMFKRLVLSSKGRSSTNLASKIGMTTAQVCSFIADSLVRRIPHYVPMIAIKDVPEVFSTCEPHLYCHLLPTRFLTATIPSKKSGPVETPLTLLCELLGLSPDQISKNIPLRDFGLDSLGAIRYSRELKSYLGIKISQFELLGSVTIAFLDSKVQEAGVASAGDVDDEGIIKDAAALLPIQTERLAYGEPYTTDATPHQSRIWARLSSTEFGHKSNHTMQHGDESHSSGYLVTITSSELNMDLMRHAFAEVVQRHGALLTTFSWSTEGNLKQTIHPFVDFDIKVVDVSHEVDPARKAREIALAACEEPDFKLDRLPLFTVTMFNLGHSTWNLSLIFHDIIMDDGSFGIVLYELFALYHHGVDSLPPQQVQFSDFSDWFFHTSDRRIGSREGQLKFWTENMKDVQPLNLGPANASDKPLSDIAEVEATIGPTILSQFRGVMGELGTTASVGFFAVFSVLLFRLSLQTSFVMGTPVSQRRIARLANVVGPITNILPIMTTIHGNQSFHDHLAVFKSNLITSLANDDVDYYEDLHNQNMNPSLHSVHGGYFAHVFAHDGLNLDSISEFASDMNDTRVHLDDIKSLLKIKKPYELFLDVYSKTGNVILRFDDHLFSAESARKILDTYIAIVEMIALDPHVLICDIAPQLGSMTKL